MEDQSKGSKAFRPFKRSKNSATPRESQEAPQYKPRHKKSLASLGRLFQLTQSQPSPKQPDQPATPYMVSQSGSFGKADSPASDQTSKYQSSPGLKSSSQQLGQPLKEGFGLPEDDGDYQNDSEDEYNQEEEEEPEAALLGSVDYHNFLCGTSSRKTKITLGSISPTQPGASTPKQGVDSSLPQSVIRTKPSNKALVLGRSDQTSLQTLRTKQSLPLRERRSQRLVEQFATTGLPQLPAPIRLRQPSKRSLSSSRSQSQRLAEQITFIGTPKAGPNFQPSSLKEPLTTPSTSRPSSPGPAQLSPTPLSMDKVSSSSQPTSLPELPPTPGPAGFISSKEIDPEKLQPFIGPLLPQQPPPNKPLPHPPSTTMPRPRKNTVRGDLADDTESKTDGVSEFSLPPPTQDPFPATTPAKQRLFSMGSKGSKGKGSIDIGEDREDSMEPMSEKTMRHGLRNKVSKLFGDGPAPPRPADTSSTTASGSIYRPISLNSHKADEISFSGIFDDVYNASRNSTADSVHSAGAMSTLSQDLTGGSTAVDTHDSRGLSVHSGQPSINDPSQISAVASSTSSYPSMARDLFDTHQSSQQRNESISESVTPAPSREDVAASLASRLGLTDNASRAAILDAFTTVAPPPLTQHPAVRGDLALQARVGMIDDSTAALLPPITASTQVITINPNSGMHVPPLNIRRQRPTQVAVSTRNASRSAPAVDPLTGFTSRSLVLVPDVTAGRDSENDVDPCAAFDRCVDLTWYRFSRRVEGQNHRQSFVPLPDNMFYHVNSYFIAKCARGQPSNKYDRLTRRFRYFDLKASIRFKIMEKLLAGYLPGKPILLNSKVQASPAWPEDEFARLWDVLSPLQRYLQADPRMRADVMTAFFMVQPFHVIFSPFVKGETQPLPTKWLFRYAYFMQDIRVELDMTKLGFGPRWEATALTTRIQHIGNLVWVLVDEMLKRDPHCNPLGKLTIHCRRFFGYRQGKNPFEGDKEYYKYPLIGGEDQGKPSSYTEGTPWNYGRRAPSLPPSANNPYSGHRRHHGFAPDRVPYVHESHMSVADPFLKLTGRVWSVRFCGMSEKWVKNNCFSFWPKGEHEVIPPPELHVHLDRYLPSRHAYAAPGHAVFFDYGLRAGIHRFPPLPDSEAMVCTGFDQDNDCFVEVGSGNILTVMENGVEVIARSLHPPIPRSDLPFPGGPAVPLSGVTPPSRIPGPVHGTTSPVMQAMRNSTPRKALQLLGLEGAASGGDSTALPPSASPLEKEEEDDDDDDDDDDSLLTYPDPRFSSSTASRRQGSQPMGGNDDQLGDITSLHSRLSSVNSPAKPLALSTKKSFLGLMGADRRKPAK